jgi:hypothetical protein
MYTLPDSVHMIARLQEAQQYGGSMTRQKQPSESDQRWSEAVWEKQQQQPQLSQQDQRVNKAITAKRNRNTLIRLRKV